MTGPGHDTTAAGHGRLVLIIEDEVAIANAIRLTLRTAGFDTIELAGVAGLSSALERKPHAVILDVSLQEADGVEALRILARNAFGGRVQLISGSPRALLDDVRRVGERYGLTMLPVLGKPFRMRQVRDVMLARDDRGEPAAKPAAETGPSGSPGSVPLSDALDRGWLEAWYQPKYDLRRGTLAGAECLARIRHPDLGVMLPGSFLPGAGPDAMERLTSFMIRRSCEDWPRFRGAGPALRLAINVTVEQLLTMPLARLIRDHTPTARDWPGLILEVTEDDALRDVEAAHETATQLAIYGASLSIDDFGLGYSSLSRLREIPFREVKLDRTLVEGSAADATRGALCKAVIDLSHTLAAEVVAEGVERQDDLTYLKGLGCDKAQGFLLGRPMPAETFIGMIDQPPRDFAAEGVARSAPLATALLRRATFGLRNGSAATPTGLQL